MLALRRRIIHKISTTVHFSALRLTGDDYQYVHRSDIPTYYFQKSLRRLPIPKLSDTCHRLLAAAEAVLHKEKWELLKMHVEDFAMNEGPELQRELLLYDKRNKQTSYISEPWFDMYLSDRLPCPINHNPFLVYAWDPDEAYNDQLTRTTNLVISYGRIKRALDANCLEPEVYFLNPKFSELNQFKWLYKILPEKLCFYGLAAFGAFPLDMTQYKSLFGGSRIPQKGKDWLFHCVDSKHFIVLRGGRIYAVDLFDKHGAVVPAEQVRACLSTILAGQCNMSSEDCVGSLTTLERDEWASIRCELAAIGNNSASLASIDSALFAVCLDTTKSNDICRLIQSLLHGDDASNRWFDKCFQLIVDACGMAAINFEHSWGDGIAVLRLMEESFRDTSRNRFVHPTHASSSMMPRLGTDFREIKFTLTDSLRQKIRVAQEKHVAVGSGMHFSVVEYFGMDREFIKRMKLSPDSVVQLAIQLAFHKLFKEFVPTYESCSTAVFLKGRTECLRSATCATSNAVLAIENDKRNVGELLKNCSVVHSQLMKEAATGRGFDRHLMGLSVTAQRLGWPQPKLFDSDIYQYINRFVLSTSTLSTPTVLFGGFGPVVRNGFGVAYNVYPNKIGAIISSYKDHRDANVFANALLESLDILKYIVDRHL